MFNFFKKTKEQDEPKEMEEDNKVCISYFINKDNVPMVDIILQDYSEDSIKSLCKLLDVLSKDSFYLNTIQMLKDGFLQDDQDDSLVKVLTHVAQQSNTGILKYSESSSVCINPSDVVT